MKLTHKGCELIFNQRECSFIKPGENNKIAVRAIGNEFTFYVNEKEVACYTLVDPTFVEGRVGIGYLVWAQKEFALDFLRVRVLAPQSNSGGSGSASLHWAESANRGVAQPATDEKASVHHKWLLRPSASSSTNVASCRQIRNWSGGNN